MFTSWFSVFSALLLGFSHLVNAAPTTKPAELLAFAPTITCPTKDSIWVAGSSQQVTWETSNVPAEAQKYTLTILLGFLTPSSENLDIKNPLATYVPIMDGTTTITVPANTTFGTNYIVALIGDSGDISNQFTIFPSSS